MESLLTSYYENGAKKLHNVIDHIFKCNYGGINGKDMDEYYGIGTDVLINIWGKYKNKKSTYDPSKGDFDGYVYNALKMAFIDEFKRQNRDKRTTKIYLVDENGNKVFDEKTGKPIKIPIPDIHLEDLINEENNISYGDIIPSNFDMDNQLSEMGIQFQNDNVEKYLNSLSKIQRSIIKLKISGYHSNEIRDILKLTPKEYDRNFEIIRSYEKISILEKNILSINKRNKKEEKNIMGETLEKSKSDKLCIASITKKMKQDIIRFDHPLQRESEQWNLIMRSNFISDILQGNPIPSLVFAEQVVNNIGIIWDIDGKQRCSNVYKYRNDGYRLSKNIRRWKIEYQTPLLDENGNKVFDKNNLPVYENKICDIRGKRYSDLPEELKDKFDDYNFEIVQYLNCGSEDIAYHIARYNEGKPMTASQKGITMIGEEYASIVKNITNMPFFKDIGGYKVSEFKNGTINRVIVESIMTINFLNDWKKKLEDMCEFIKDNASIDHFDDFENIIHRIERVITDEVAEMFDSKDSFLWFGLFSEFIKLEKEDRLFINFMTEFSKSLHTLKINNISFDDLNVKSTKDKNIIINKMNHLKLLMNQFFGGNNGIN